MELPEGQGRTLVNLERAVTIGKELSMAITRPFAIRYAFGDDRRAAIETFVSVEDRDGKFEDVVHALRKHVGVIS